MSQDMLAHQDDAIACGEGEDISAGHGGFAGGLDVGLDGVDDFEATGRVGVRPCALLAGETGGVVQ